MGVLVEFYGKTKNLGVLVGTIQGEGKKTGVLVEFGGKTKKIGGVGRVSGEGKK